ncbi:MAG: sugar phosphate isomerase/epimerase [Planctomycetaceae bacterium]|nr:sugar phosphate isomerase/epimerase [Planctomycetaceae bacterium]
MRIGIQQTALGRVDLPRCLLRAKRAGAAGVGLCYHTLAEAALLEDAAYALKVRTLVERFRLAVTGLYLGVLCDEPSLIVADASQIRRAQEHVHKAIELATNVGHADVIVPFYGRNRIEFPKELDFAVSAMSALSGVAEDHGVTLAVESSLHLGQLEEFLDGCGSDFVKICLDTGDVTACRRDPANMVLGLGRDRIAQVHLKDVCLTSGLAPDFNVRLGHGNVNFSSLAGALRSVAYDGWLVLETPPGDERGVIARAHVEDAQDMIRRWRCHDTDNAPLSA